MDIKRIIREPDVDFMVLKKIVQLHDYVIKPEVQDYKIVLVKIFYEDRIKFILRAIYWKKNNYLNYKRVKSDIEIRINELNKYSMKSIKNILLSEIYRQVIKNNILML